MGMAGWAAEDGWAAMIAANDLAVTSIYSAICFFRQKREKSRYFRKTHKQQ
jgi:hypothetical protein